MYLSDVKPFCARDTVKSLVFFNLLFKALDMTLYRQLSNEIGRQLPILDVSPFFGIILILAVLNVWVREPLLMQKVE